MAALSDSERGRLYDAILEYGETGVVPELGGRESILFPVFQAQLDRDAISYQNKVNGASKSREIRRNQSDIRTNQIDAPRNQEQEEEKEEEKETRNKIQEEDKDTTTKSLTDTSNLAVGGGDPDLEDIVRLWDKVSGCRLSAWDAETLSTLLAEHGKEKLTHAINVAAGNGAPRLAYVDAVLRNRGKARNNPKEKKRSGKYDEIYDKY